MTRVIHALGVLVTLCFLTTASYSADATLAGYEVVGGFVEDDGTAHLLYRRVPGSSDGGSSDSSALVRIGSNGAIADSVELPEVWGKSLLRHGERSLLLWSLKGPRDRDGHGVLVREVVQFRADATLRQLWEWNSDDHPAWLDYSFSVSRDGKLWGVAAPGLKRREGSTRMYDGLEIATGDFRKRQAKVARILSVRFEEPLETRQWAPEVWGGWTILDSTGPVLAVSWQGREFVAHCDKRECSYRVPVFSRAEERLGIWHSRDKVLWSSTAGAWRAYHLWNLGLSGGGDEPIWEVERASGWQPHSERGMVRMIRREGEYRIEHVWRDPWTSREELHATEWQSGSPPRGVYSAPDLLVSASGRHALVLESRRSEEGESVMYARRIGLDLLPARPLVKAASVESDGPQDVEEKSGY